MPESTLSPEMISSDLKTRFVGQRVIYFRSLDSTMDAARREAQWGAEAGTVIVTDEQVSGRGRLQRTWLSPQGSLAFSLILRPNIEYIYYMIMLASVAVCRGIETATGLQCQIKWPNDILINEKKVSGILIENDIRKNTLSYVIIGIGINVNVRISDYPEIAAFATSLSDHLEQEVSRLEVIRQVLVNIDGLYGSMPENDFIQQEWKNRLSTLGQNVEIKQGNRWCRGIAENVTRDGGLVIRQKDGRSVKVISGDIVLR
ncbi:MAG: biotin--[acetyl-CoA-carboxylase] ligase [Dehalococcoidales bacterium]|nr:biotin--[acetyl-CoA-carboxylase] ligase [Dehalococcoidales bacterium]